MRHSLAQAEVVRCKPCMNKSDSAAVPSSLGRDAGFTSGCLNGTFRRAMFGHASAKRSRLRKKKISASSTAGDETFEAGRMMFSFHFYPGVCKQKTPNCCR